MTCQLQSSHRHASVNKATGGTVGLCLRFSPETGKVLIMFNRNSASSSLRFPSQPRATSRWILAAAILALVASGCTEDRRAREANPGDSTTPAADREDGSPQEIFKLYTTPGAEPSIGCDSYAQLTLTEVTEEGATATIENRLDGICTLASSLAME